MSQTQKTAPRSVPRKPYVLPTVVKHGTIKELTRGTGSTATESKIHTAKKAGRK